MCPGLNTSDMIKNILVVLIILFPAFMSGQVALTVQFPSSGIILKSQLWDISVVNNSSGSMNVKILLVVQQSQTGQVLFTANSNAVTIPKGIRIFSSGDLQPIQYQFSSYNSNAYLPVGSFIACYTVSGATDDPQPLATECTNINISPVSPPLLVSPADECVLHTKTPQFTWVGPAPGEMYSDLNYDLIVAEISDGQLAEEAVTNNIPVYSKSHLTSTFDNYPSTFESLKPGKSYAWKVVSHNGNSAPVGTATWTFTISNDSTKPVTASKNYILLKNQSEEPGVAYLSSKELNIKYYSFEKEYDALIQLKSVDGKIIKEYRQNLKYGDNYFSLKLNYQFIKETVYRIELIDKKAGRNTALFSIK
jgi:hypothetical protein